jgi:glucokinase
LTTIGIDIGGTSAKLGLVGPDGTVHARDVVPTGAGATPEALVAATSASVRRFVADAEQAVTAVGVGCAGLVDTDRGAILVSPNLPLWHDVILGDLLSKAITLPVHLINDADAFAYGEAHEGAGAGCVAGLFLTLGTGVGGAIVLGGELYRGAHGLAGEVGHIVVDIDGERDGCGLPGCLERLVGNARIVERAERRIRSGAPGAAIADAAEGGAITPKAIAAAAAAGDETARDVYAEVGTILGTTLAGLNNLLSLDAIVIGGGVSEAGDILFEPIAAAFRARSMVPRGKQPAIRRCRFGADAGLIGAALFARDRSGMEPLEPLA